VLLPAEVWTVAKTDRGNAVLVKPKDLEEAVPIFIGTSEAQNILLGMGDVDVPRPLTHDLYLNTLEMMGGTLKQIEIHSLIDGTFYANIIISRDKQTITIDGRPSDALALAVRKAAPVFIEETIVKETAITLANQEHAETIIDEETEEPGHQLQGSAASEAEGENALGKLQASLAKAVEEENYEQAAQLRDEITKLGGDPGAPTTPLD
jgi:bifunctional DNase/RNase